VATTLLRKVRYASTLAKSLQSLGRPLKTGTYPSPSYPVNQSNASLSLFIDVWAPANVTSTSNLPVKVWIHGSGDQGGGIQNPLYDGCNLVAHDTLLVSISYRVGPLGFLTLDSAGIAGNFGIQDLLLGLEWVQSNIAAFGGNPVSYRRLSGL
jgi:carboxylesterase type B